MIRVRGVAGSCLLYCRLRLCWMGGKGGSCWFHRRLRLCRGEGDGGFMLVSP